MIRIVFPVLLCPLWVPSVMALLELSKHWTCSKGSHSSSAEGPVISSPVPKDNVSTGEGF